MREDQGDTINHTTPHARQEAPMAEMDFETASGEELAVWTLKYDTLLRESLAALRDRIVAQVEARVRAETVDREAITDERMRAAWDEAYRRVAFPGRKMEWADHRPVDIAWHREFIAAFHGLPAPQSVTPCDVCGSPDGAHDDLHDCVRHLRKAFAATVEGR